MDMVCACRCGADRDLHGAGNREEVLNDDSLFWSGVALSVLGLSLPTFLALGIVVSALFYPNGFIYAIFPLAVIAPVCLISSIVLLFMKRQQMSHVLYRRVWAVIGLAVFAGVTTIRLVYHS
jgi:hypothetical protein